MSQHVLVGEKKELFHFPQKIFIFNSWVKQLSSIQSVIFQNESNISYLLYIFLTCVFLEKPAQPRRKCKRIMNALCSFQKELHGFLWTFTDCKLQARAGKLFCFVLLSFVLRNSSVITQSPSLYYSKCLKMGLSNSTDHFTDLLSQDELSQ